jgi:general stress protein CsbA
MRTNFIKIPRSIGSLAARRSVWLGVAALGLAGLFAGLQVSTWPGRLRYPGELKDIEGMRLAEMVHLRQGLRIYDPALPDRFDAAIYGPLYYLLGARLVDPEAPTYFLLRLASTLGTMGLATACGVLACRLSRSYLAAFLAPLVFLSSGIVTSYGTANRADSVALLLVLSGVLLAYRSQQSPALVGAAALMLLGIFYKQQYVAGPLAVVLFLVIEKRYRLAIRFSGLLVLGGLSLLALFQFAVFPGQAFFHHFFLYNLLPISGTQFAKGLAIFAVALLLPFAVGVEFLRVHHDRFVACYLGCAVLVAILASGKEGSASNYFIEPLLIVSALFPALIMERMGDPIRAAVLVVLLTVTLIAGRLYTPVIPKHVDIERDRTIQGYLRGNFAPGAPALGFYTGDLLRAGLATPIPDLYQYVHLIRAAILGSRELESRLQQRQFQVIILNFDLRTAEDVECLNRCLTDRLRQIILENYRLAKSLDLPEPEKFHRQDRFYAWVPRQSDRMIDRTNPDRSRFSTATVKGRR